MKTRRPAPAGLQVFDGDPLPLDWLTLSTVAYGVSGSGKSTFARRVCEAVHASGHRFCIVDPKGDAWGVTSSADGRGEGLPVVIFGGDQLRSAGHVEGTNARLQATGAGRKAFGRWTPLPRGAALAEHWYGQLGKAEREILRVVVEAHPKQVPLDLAATKCGYSPSSGGVRNAAGKLRTLELVEGSNAGMRANEKLID